MSELLRRRAMDGDEGREADLDEAVTTARRAVEAHDRPKTLSTLVKALLQRFREPTPHPTTAPHPTTPHTTAVPHPPPTPRPLRRALPRTPAAPPTSLTPLTSLRRWGWPVARRGTVSCVPSFAGRSRRRTC